MVIHQNSLQAVINNDKTSENRSIADFKINFGITSFNTFRGNGEAGWWPTPEPLSKVNNPVKFTENYSIYIDLPLYLIPFSVFDHAYLSLKYYVIGHEAVVGMETFWGLGRDYITLQTQTNMASIGYTQKFPLENFTPYIALDIEKEFLTYTVVACSWNDYSASSYRAYGINPNIGIEYNFSNLFFINFNTGWRFYSALKKNDSEFQFSGNLRNLWTPEGLFVNAGIGFKIIH